MSTGKSPGPDGFGSEFYKAFRTEIAVVLHNVIKEAYRTKKLSPSFRQSHVVLFPKTEDPAALLSVRAYRPITLTNTDYKIFAKVLGRRLQSVITRLVGPHQTCGIKGRSIVTNIHVARTVLECCDAYCGRVAMVQLDLEKAFDRVVHKVLFNILEHINVGKVLSEGIEMYYADISSRIKINKSLTASFQINSSVRQGCPLSPLLFALYLEPFCLKIMSSSAIKGFRLSTSEVKLPTYADDIAVFCSDQDSVSNAISVARSFCKVTGSVINWSKSLGFWHGDWDDTPDVFESMQWTVSPTKYLGVPLNHYKDTSDYWRN